MMTVCDCDDYTNCRYYKQCVANHWRRDDIEKLGHKERCHCQRPYDANPDD